MSKFEESKNCPKGSRQEGLYIRADFEFGFRSEVLTFHVPTLNPPFAMTVLTRTRLVIAPNSCRERFSLQVMPFCSQMGFRSPFHAFEGRGWNHHRVPALIRPALKP
jgi:hypothetical protein